jgi:hypothetical protein
MHLASRELEGNIAERRHAEKALEIPEPESTKRLPPIPVSMDKSPSLGRLNGRSPCAASCVAGAKLKR